MKGYPQTDELIFLTFELSLEGHYNASLCVWIDDASDD